MIPVHPINYRHILPTIRYFSFHTFLPFLDYFEVSGELWQSVRILTRPTVLRN
jgi:hypothetical protein